MHLFAYGTLMDPATMARVAGRVPGTPEPARLHGYRRRDTRFGYPAIFPAPGAVVEGVLWRGLTPAELARLDEYEDEGLAYTRTLVTVQAAAGPVQAWVYVGRPEFFAGALI